MDHNASLIDLLDRNERAIGTLPLERASRLGLKNIRSVILFVVNCCGQILLGSKRGQDLSKGKDLTKQPFHSRFQFPQSVPVKAGETYQQALVRSLEQNWNIDIQESDIAMLGVVNPFIHSVTTFYGVFRATCVSHCNSERFENTNLEEHFWLSPSDLLSSLQHKTVGSEPTQDIPYLLSLFESDFSPNHMRLPLKKANYATGFSDVKGPA